MRRLVALLILPAIVGSPGFSGAQQHLDVSAPRIDSIVEAHRTKYRVPAVGLYVGSISGARLYERAYGSARLSPDVRATKETRFYLASVSKPYAAAVAHHLVDEGRLDLRAPISRYLSGLPPWGDTVTTRQLLTHTSGIRDFTDVAGWSDTANAGDFIQRALALPLLFPPGARSDYSNTNYALVEEILDRITGLPYAQAASALVLRPLGLSETQFACATTARNELAQGYRLRRDTLRTVARPRPDHYPDAVAGLCSTAQDVARFFTQVLVGRLLADSSAAAMHTAPLHDEVEATFGEGLGVSRELTGEIWSHSGGGPGVSTEVAIWPADSLVVVVLTNLTQGEAELLTRSIARSFLQLPQPTVRDLPVEPDRIGSYAGEYRADPQHVVITERDSHVYEFGAPCYYQGSDIFICGPDKRTLRFVRVGGQVREVWEMIEGVRRFRGLRSQTRSP
jgi:CubicO group peptidase (beta-lactamase class C family)